MVTEIRKRSNRYTLNQWLKLKEIAIKLNLQNSKPVGTPMDPGFYKIEDDEFFFTEQYCILRKNRVIIIYSNHYSSRHILYCKYYQQKVWKSHVMDWKAVKRVINYPNCKKELKLTINTKPTFKAYADATWQAIPEQENLQLEISSS